MFAIHVLVSTFYLPAPSQPRNDKPFIFTRSLTSFGDKDINHFLLWPHIHLRFTQQDYEFWCH